MTEENKLQKLIRPAAKQIGIHAKLAQAKDINDNINPLKQQNRIGIVFDDSGSMHGEAIKQAQEAVGAFLRSCNPNRESIAIYPMNASPKSLCANMMLVDMYVQGIGATGGTPLYSTCKQCINNEPVNHLIVFSDGSPTDRAFNARDPEREVVDMCIERAIKIDTVYIGYGKDDPGGKTLERLSEKTGGIYLHFTDASVFAKNMRYLAPTYRAMLTNPDVKARIEKGEKV